MEIISMDVVVENVEDGNGSEGELTFELDDNVDLITLKLDGEEVCKFDYDNFEGKIKRILEIWGKEE